MRLPADLRRPAALVLGLAAVAATLYQAPESFRGAEDAVSAVASTPRANRQLLAGREFDMNTDFFVAAARTIPPDRSFAFISGRGVAVSNDIVLAKAPIFAAYYLLPRRMVDVSRADWIVSYGGDIAVLHEPIARRIEVSPGYVLAEIRR
jgi:hypothetical protein